MPAAYPIAPGWIPTASGALDVHDSPALAPDGRILLAPARPGQALYLIEPAASLWRRLVREAPLPRAAFSSDDALLLEEFDRLGIAAFASSHPSAFETLKAPTLSSPMHELVYALVGSVARARGIPTVFVKGPALHHQGLRVREHSGDVDVWCPPSQAEALATALEEWGWRRAPDPLAGTPVPHSITMEPAQWGCEIDVHRRLPGLTLDDDTAFDRVQGDTVVVTYAGVEVRVPAPATHAVLAAVHAVRPEIAAPDRSAAASALAATMLSAVGGPAIDRARRIGAVSALREELHALAPGETFDDDETPRDWEWRGQPTRAHSYVMALRAVPARDRARVLWRLVWPSDAVALASARAAHEPTDDPARARRTRLLRGARAAVAALCRTGRRGRRP